MMTAPTQLWSRTWALVDKVHRCTLSPGIQTIGDDHRAPLWLYEPSTKPLLINGSAGGGEKVRGFDHSNTPRTLIHAPLPLRKRQGTKVKVGDLDCTLEWPSFPERPPTKHQPQTDEEQKGHDLFLRAYSVWDRLRDVDTALADPAFLWEELRRRWTSDDRSEPQMDVIVEHAKRLRRTIDELERTPRRILRRTHQQIPLSRVQELDRRSMTWLVRQPGSSLAERAGDRQAILAVAREENFNTLENRVLRAYSELAAFVAADYISRNQSKAKSKRASLVGDFGRRCKRLSRELASRGVGLAEPGCMPNFVLQQNPRYNSVWNAWDELLKRELVNDDLWRWQGRSWEEFCALAVMVGLVNIPGAKLVASAPISFRTEQKRGRWLDHDNPLGAFYLEQQGLVVEVRFDMNRPGTLRADFGAPIWITLGKTGDSDDFLTNIPVWPVWDHEGGIVPGESSALRSVPYLWDKKTRINAGLILRPASNIGPQSDQDGPILSLCIGTQGPPLHEAITSLSAFFSSLIIGNKNP